MITAILIKRVEDNRKLAEQILEKHYGPDINSSITRFFQTKISNLILKSVISFALAKKKAQAAGVASQLPNIADSFKNTPFGSVVKQTSPKNK